MLTAGIDIGSITTKAALIKDGIVIASLVLPTGYNAELAGKKAYKMTLELANIEPASVDKIVSTGYGRNSIKFADKAMSEIVCHGAGAFFLNPQIRTVIDIGGQDSKGITLDSSGKIKDFAMNDKCAAGTGRFIEVMARALEVELENLGGISLKSDNPSKISSMCTVFAESEVISLISNGENRSNIIAGIHDSIASRVSALIKRLGVQEPVLMTGGVAKNTGVVHAMEKKLNVKIDVNDNAQLTGAIGAAVKAAAL